MFNSGAGGDTIPPSRCLTCYGRVTSKGYPALGTCTTLQYHFYNATCPPRCIHESLLAFYQLGNYYGRYTLSVCPSVCGWHAVDILTSRSKSSITQSQNVDWNWLSLSETTELGNPCKRHTSRRKMFATIKSTVSTIKKTWYTGWGPIEWQDPGMGK